MTLHEYTEALFWLKGKTIAIIYNYAGDSDGGAKKYDFWEGDVVSDWIHAVYELHGMPFILDARTFVEKAMNTTLPPIDYVVDLNDGFYNLSSLGLVPSTCAYCNIPCIPCDASVLLMGENKFFTNVIAESYGFNLPKFLSEETDTSITRPYCLGSSCGVIKGKSKSSNMKTIIQEFIPGFDVTIPLLYCPTVEELVALPAVAYSPDNYDPQWFLGEQQKKSHSEYKKCIVSVDKQTQDMVKNFSNHLGIQTYCRIDFRCICNNNNEMMDLINNEITWDKLRFIELNPLPTIKENINFLNSLSSIPKDHPIASCVNYYINTTRNATLTGFVLSSSIIAYLRAKR